MGRGKSSKIGRVGTKDSGTKIQFDVAKAGKIYQDLPGEFQYSIRSNLELSQAMRDNIDSDNPITMTDEWVAGLKGVKEKRKVITRYENGKLFYTVKMGNKILLKDGTVEQAANQIAIYYKKYLK